jgi:hypothetical protein
MEAFADRLMQKRQRIVTVNAQSVWNCVGDLLYSLCELRLFLCLFQSGDKFISPRNSLTDFDYLIDEAVFPILYDAPIVCESPNPLAVDLCLLSFH